MILSSVFIPSLFLIGASALPSSSTTTVHGTTVEVVQDIVNSWNWWQIQINGSDATIAELHAVITDNNRRDEEARGVGKRCTWNDGFGDIDCAYWSFTLGEQGGFHNRDFLVVYGQGWKIQFGSQLGCTNYGASGDWWVSFTSPLPWTIDIHPGNTCFALASGSQFWDNCWIKYASEFVNMPTDSRCGNIFDGWGRRCILPRH